MKRLLVIRFSALGDVAMTVPVVRALADQYPDLQITVLTQPKMTELFEELSANVKSIGVDVHKQSLRDIVRSLGSYDLVADLHSVWRSLYIRWALRLKGAKVRSLRKPRMATWLLTHGYDQTIPGRVDLYADVFRRLGVPVRLEAYKADGSKGAGVGIAPFAAHAGKQYPLIRMEKVVQMLSERGEEVVLFGSASERSILEKWTKYPHVRCVAGQLSLREELELMRGLRVMVTMDSANMHLASIVGTRVVSIWGATHPAAGYLGFGQSRNDCVQRSSLKMTCRPCSTYGQTKCTQRRHLYACLDIRPEDIISRIYDLSRPCDLP